MDNKKIKIYLSGAITGRKNYKEEFYKAKEQIQEYLKHKDIEADIIVPCDYDYLNKTGKWEDYLKTDIKMLVDCDCLIDIENESKNSKGVMLEKMICVALGISIYNFDTFRLRLESMHTNARCYK